jgi:ABC-type uncharacterized transport system permease subunit
MKSGESFGDRLFSAALGALFGALIGLACAWIFGVYSNRLGAGAMDGIVIKNWMAYGAIVFGVLGLLVGSKAGGAVGGAIASLINFEDTNHDPQVPTWFAVIFLIAVAFCVWWFIFR